MYYAYSDGPPYRIFKQMIFAARSFSNLEGSELPSDLLKNQNRTPPENLSRFTTLNPNGSRLLLPGGVGQYQELCGEPGCLAVAFERDGKVAHKWPIDLEALQTHTSGQSNSFEYDGSNISNDLTVVSLTPFSNGDLLAGFVLRNAFPYGWGLARINQAGKVVWRRIDYHHHWSRVAENGKIYSPYYELRSGKRYKDYSPHARPFLICGFPDKQYADQVHILTPEGITEKVIDLAELFGKDEVYSYLLARTVNRCDPFHLNFVDVATRTQASKVDWLEPGDILLSFRALSALAVLDAPGEKIKKIYTGSFNVQHSAQFGDDGKLYLFDNMGSAPEQLPSRLVSIDLTTGVETVEYARTKDDAEAVEFSSASGNVDIDPVFKTALMAYTLSGRVTEVNLTTGKAVSIFENWHEGQESTSGFYKIYGAWYLPPDFPLK